MMKYVAERTLRMVAKKPGQNPPKYEASRTAGKKAMYRTLSPSTMSSGHRTSSVPAGADFQNSEYNAWQAGGVAGSVKRERLMAHLLLIDDDPDLIAEQVRQAFPRHRVEVAGTGADGLKRVRTEPPDVILLDLRLPDQFGLEVYQQLRQIDARIPVIFVTMAKTADAAIEAMKQGAYDYLFKPLDLNQLRRVVGEALEVARRMREPAVVAETARDPDVEGAIIGSCPAMREVYKAIGRVAGQDVPVLITGESGTGKELVA